MKQTEFVIDGDNFSDYDGFIAEFNRGFVQQVGANWNGNLDAFNDYLSWCDDQCCIIRWRNSGKSKLDLGASFDLIMGIIDDNREFIDISLE